MSINISALSTLINSDRWGLTSDKSALTFGGIGGEIVVQFIAGEAVIEFDDPFSGEKSHIRMRSWTFGTIRALLSSLEIMIAVAGVKRDREV